MSTTLQPFLAGKLRAFDANGEPLAGGLLYAYAAGTTTPQDTYTTSAGTIANANPVVLDANGEADVFMGTAGNYKFVLKDSAGATQWTEDNYPPGSSGSGGSGSNSQDIEPGGRLTLTSGTPVTTGDVTAATTIYYAPYKHDLVPIYNGTSWSLFSIGSGISQTTTDNTKSPAAVANNSNYDLFVWNDAGTVRLSRGPAWTSSSARGTGVGTTELTQVAGKWVNANSVTNGPAAHCGLYVGTIRSDGSAHANDSLALRLVWNMHNRRTRPMSVLGAATAYAYNTAAWRQAHADAANQLSVVVGLSEDALSVRVVHNASANSDANNSVSTGIGLDATNTPASGCITQAASVPGSTAVPLTASWVGFPGLGFHFLAWLEYGATNSGSTFFAGVGAPGQAGIHGEALA